MRTFKVLFATVDYNGLKSKISELFGRANTFTIIEVADENVAKVEIIENPYKDLKHGVGPLIVRMFKEYGIDAVVGSSFGFGMSTLLDEHNIRKFTVRAGTIVENALRDVVKKL